MDAPNMDNDYMDKSNHQKNQFSFFDERVSPNTYEKYEDSEVNFQQTVEDISSYHTMADVNHPIIMTENAQVSKSLNVTRSFKTPLNVEKLVSSDRRAAIEEEEDQPSLQSPAPRKQDFHQIQKSADFRDAFQSVPSVTQDEKKESSADRYKVQHVIKGLKHQTSCRPASQYVEQSKSNRKSSKNSRYDEKQNSWENQTTPCSSQKPNIAKKIIEFPESHFSDNTTPIKDGETQRSKSLNAQYGCMQAADVQAHLEHLRQRNLAQSPFQNLKEQPHFESLYKLRIQQQLSPFEQNLPMTPTSLLELTQTNPLAQSMRQSLASNQMAQLLSSSMQGLPGSGHQYEVLLNEKQSLQSQIGELHKQIEENKKVVNQLKTQISLQKIELADKDEDLDEVKNNFHQKISDQKETIERLNRIIEEQAAKLIENQTKERQAMNCLQKKNTEMAQNLEAMKKEIEIYKKQGQQEDGKCKEIYSLTVELGCLREENSEQKKNIEAQKTDFEQRLQDQRSRANEEYSQILQEMEQLRLDKDQEITDAKAKIEQLKLEHDKQVMELHDRIQVLSVQYLKMPQPQENHFQEKLDTIKSEKSLSAERQVNTNPPPCSTKVICSPDQEESLNSYLKETSEFGKIITESSIIEQQEHRIVPISPPVKSDFAESFDERKQKEYSPFRNEQRSGLQRCQSDFGIKMNNHLNKSSENSMRASQEVRQSIQTIQRPLTNAHPIKHNFNRPAPSLASNLIAQRKKTQKSAGKTNSSILSQSFVSQRSKVEKTSASRIGVKAREQKIIRKEPVPKFSETMKSSQKSPTLGSQTTRGQIDQKFSGSMTNRGHLDQNRALIDASNRITTPRKDQPLVSSRLATSRQMTGRASPKPMLSSRISYNPPQKKSGNEENTEMKQKLQSIQTGKAYLEKKIQEYESRLTQMKNKKEKSRACLIGGPSTNGAALGWGNNNRTNSRSQLF